MPRSRAGACRPRRQVASTYTVELNDLGLFTFKSLTEPDFVRIVTDQLDQLYADSATSDRVMTLALHPCVIGQPPEQVRPMPTADACLGPRDCIGRPARQR